MSGNNKASSPQLTLLAPVDGLMVPIEELPDAVFAGKLMGDGVSIDPTGSLLLAPCAGHVVQLHRAKHALTLRTDSGVSILLHVGLDTVTMDGKGFTALVKEGDRVESRQPLLEFDLDAISVNALSALTQVVITEGGSALSFKRTHGLVKAGVDEVVRVGADVVQEASPNSGEIVRSGPITILNPNGLHARPAAQLSSKARQFTANIFVHAGDRKAPATSVSDLMALDLIKGDRIWLSASGADAERAILALKALFEKGLGEELDASPADAAPVRQYVSDNPNVIGGVPAAPGMAVGQVRIKAVAIPDFERTTEQPEEEQRKLRGALASASDELRIASIRYEQEGELEKSQIFTAHAELLADTGLQQEAIVSIQGGASAAAAWHDSITARAKKLSGLNNPLMRQRADDLKDVGRRVLLKVLGVEPEVRQDTKETVLVCDELTPSDVASFDAERIGALVTQHGGATSHAAIIARSMGIPYVAGVGAELARLQNGARVIVDGDQGSIELEPSTEKLTQARREIAERTALAKVRLGSANQPAATADGHHVEVAANIGTLRDATLAVEQGCDGIGLLRSEFLFVGRRSAPDEAEQRGKFESIAKTLGKTRKLVIRTLDVGGDKPLSYLPMAAEENPFLGVRGLRLSLRNPELFSEQIRAIVAAAPHTQLHIMFPMVSALEEFREARSIVAREMERMKVPKAQVALGIMVEVPSAALLADVLAREVDFFSIGTNDLTQYTLAMDRGHPELAAQADALDPSVLRLVEMTVKAAHAHKKWVGLCGGLASEIVATPLLVGLGLDELSVPAAVIPELKATVRELNFKRCQALSEQALQLSSASDVRALLRSFRKPSRGAAA